MACGTNLKRRPSGHPADPYYTQQYQARRATKLSLANFLCTTYDAPSKAATERQLGTLKPAPFPELPHALAPSTSHAPVERSSASTGRTASVKPLYYLPFKLLPWQADKIDGQMEDMREELDKEEASWTSELSTRETELAELRQKLDELNAEAGISSDRPGTGAGAGGAEGRRRREGEGRAASARDAAAAYGARRGGGSDRMDEDDRAEQQNGRGRGEELVGRAPLPERDELEDDRGVGNPYADEDDKMAAVEAGEDVLEY